MGPIDLNATHGVLAFVVTVLVLVGYIYRAGQRAERIEMRLDEHDKRLEKGDSQFDVVEKMALTIERLVVKVEHIEQLLERARK